MNTQALTRRVRSPEDNQVGDFVTVTYRRYEFVPDHLEPTLGGSEIEPINLVAPPHDAGTPLKVISLCLPFLIAETATDVRVVIDTRRNFLAKVSEDYAMAAKPKAKKKDKKKGKGKGKNKKGKKN